MSTYLIGAKSHDPEILAMLRKLLPEISLADLRNHLADGSPFIERSYPMSDAEEVARLLRTVVAQLKGKNVDPIIHVIEDGAEFDPSDETTRETAEVMEKLLQSTEEIVAEQGERSRHGM